MDFKDVLKMHSTRVKKLKSNCTTEEATKTALILPFLQVLGYDIFDPTEVIPEYTCDIGTKKGEKIDYAILKDGKPIILIECKHLDQDLDIHSGQLLRYFHVSEAKFGILTNGCKYRFYTDLENKNIMDDKPFFEMDIENLKDLHVDKIKEFHKENFNVDSILNTASELKYTNEIRNAIVKDMQNPSDDFVKYFTRPVYSGRISEPILEQFRSFVKKAFQQYINDYVNDKIKSAISREEPVEITQLKEETHDTVSIEESEDVEDNKIVTTMEELQGYMIVKAILFKHIEMNRVYYRDTQSYFGILLDDNNRKPICRLHFNRANAKYVETFDEEKKGTRHPIDNLDDIYNLSEEIINSLKNIL